MADQVVLGASGQSLLDFNGDMVDVIFSGRDLSNASEYEVGLFLGQFWVYEDVRSHGFIT